MNKIPLTFLIVFLSCLGCTAEQHDELKVFRSFPKSENLKHSKIKIMEPLTPSSVHLIDSLIVFVSLNSDYAFHFYRISDWSPLGKYGKIGDGPHEVRRPIFHGQFAKNKGQTHFWFSDFDSFELKKVSLKEALNNPDAQPLITHKLPPELAMTYDDVYAISDNEFVGTVEGDIAESTDDKAAGRFFWFNTNDKSIEWVPNFPKQDLKVEKEKIGYLYSSKSAFNTLTNQIASAMRYYDRIDVIDVVAKEILTIMEEGKQQVVEVDLRDSRYLIPLDVKLYNGYVYGTEKYIYHLYSVTTGQQGVDFAQGNKSTFPNLQLRVFDWKGNPIYKAQLDRWSLDSFFVDEHSWKMYAIDYERENEDELIISYDLRQMTDEQR